MREIRACKYLCLIELAVYTTYISGEGGERGVGRVRGSEMAKRFTRACLVVDDSLDTRASRGRAMYTGIERYEHRSIEL